MDGQRSADLDDRRDLGDGCALHAALALEARVGALPEARDLLPMRPANDGDALEAGAALLAMM